MRAYLGRGELLEDKEQNCGRLWHWIIVEFVSVTDYRRSDLHSLESGFCLKFDVVNVKNLEKSEHVRVTCTKHLLPFVSGHESSMLCCLGIHTIVTWILFFPTSNLKTRNAALT
jgi:hypothetical protein